MSSASPAEKIEPWKSLDMDKRQFASWEAFFAYMDVYQYRTKQVFSRRTATSVKTRNHVLSAIAVAGREMPTPLLPEVFLDYTRTLQCAHKSTGTQTQSRWNGVQASECQARIVATLQRCPDGKYRVCVTTLDLAHNHPLSRSASTSPPASTTGSATASPAAPPNSVPNRVTPPTATAHSSSSSSTAQAPPKRRRVGRPRKCPPPPDPEPELVPVPSMTDVRLFLQRVERVRAQQPGLVQSVEERLASYVNEFAAQDGNVAKIFVDSQKVLSSITLQTKHMRKVFQAFPEVLRVDGLSSAETPSSGSSYRVFSFMAHDTFGNWQYVQHAIVENGHSETLRAALNQFKTHNEQHKLIRALIVRDGDSPVLSELCEAFPSARVLYSQFHALRSLHDAIADYGRDLSSWHKDRLTGITQALVYAPTPQDYAINVAMMEEVLGTKQHPFSRYFSEKWDFFRDRWTTFAREGVTTFSIAEGGNQFAVTWKEIFDAANDELALDETVAAIRYYQAVEERAFLRELQHAVTNADSTTRWRGVHNSDEYDAEMRLLAATLSSAASSLIFPQYRHAATRARYQFCEPTRGSFFVSAVASNDAFNDEPTKEFCVEADRGWQCSCAFMVNHHLPCRHVFYIRRIVRCNCVIPLEAIEPRWVLEKAQRYFDAPQVSSQARGILSEAWRESETESDFDRRNVIAQPGAWQKYVTALEIGKRIALRMMEMDPAEFDHGLRFYKLVETTMNARPFDINSSAIAAQINSHVRQTARPPAPAPVSASASALAGRVFGSDYAAAARAMNARLAELSKTKPARVTPPMSSEQVVIDLADDDEAEASKDEDDVPTETQADSNRNKEVNESPTADRSPADEEQVESEPDADMDGHNEDDAVSASNKTVDSDDERFTPEQAEEHDSDALLRHLDEQI